MYLPLLNLREDCKKMEQLDKAVKKFAQRDDKMDIVEDVVSGVLDSTPVVGHIKAFVHKCNGEEEKVSKAMESANKSSLVFAAGFLTGGLGAAPVAGYVAGALAGTAYDGVATLVDKDGGNRGIFGVADPDKTNVEKVMAILTPVGDAMVGGSGAKFGAKFRCKVSGQAKLKNTFKKNKVENPKKATKSTMKAGEQSKKEGKILIKKAEDAGKELKDPVVTTYAKDSASGESAFGVNKNVRNKLGKPRCTEKTFMQKRCPDVKKAMKKSHSKCAEQAAFNELGSKAPNFEAKNVYISTVKTEAVNGRAVVKTFGRCDNCLAYGSEMGTVFTDLIKSGTPVPSSGYSPNGSCSGGALRFLAALPFFVDGEGFTGEA